MRVGICSGYFALGCHAGHLDLIYGAIDQCDELYVIINNDVQTSRKYGFVPMTDWDRKDIIDRLWGYDAKLINGWISVDEDESVARTIEFIVKFLISLADTYHTTVPTFTFFNSGDRHPESANASELEVCERLGIEVKYLDMPKRGSSTSLLRKIGEHYIANPHRLAYDGLDMTDEQKRALYLAQNDFRRGDYMTVPTFNLDNLEFKRSPLERDLKPGDIGYI